LEIEKINYSLELSLEHLLGRSSEIKTVIKQIKHVAQTDFSVIIQGETGTGKSFAANAIHDISKRANKPFMSVDIGLMPDTLVESELFGHKKGSFTGAEKDKAGYFEIAHGGTIFIDELENMSPGMQGKLLTVIDKKKIYPLGSTTPLDIDVRIIASTNKDIRQGVIKKEFREDLFYRLGEFIITLPPLRERIDDIPFFARKFVYEAGRELNKQIKEITDEAIVFLTNHNWPGNIRELKNVMRRAVLFAEGDIISQECINFLIREQSQSLENNIPPNLSFRDALTTIEKKLISDALIKAGGNKTKAAKLLDMSYRRLFEKIKEYGLA
jgi:transcriptional regulator with PAS, ATPase and Fis domain